MSTTGGIVQNTGIVNFGLFRKFCEFFALKKEGYKAFDEIFLVFIVTAWPYLDGCLKVRY
jgi:hypothetical protein